MLLAFVVTKENNSEEIKTAREGDRRASQARNPCLLSQRGQLEGVKDKRSEVTGGGRQLVMHLQDTTEE